MKGSIEHTRVAINTMRARLTILGFNLAIITFQLSNTRRLGGGTRIEGFETTVHFSTGVVLLTGLALSISSMVVFISSSSFDREGTCDSRMLLAGDFLMYLALSQTVSGFFSSYGRVLDIMLISAQTGDACSTVRPSDRDFTRRGHGLDSRYVRRTDRFLLSIRPGSGIETDSRCGLSVFNDVYIAAVVGRSST